MLENAIALVFVSLLSFAGLYLVRRSRIVKHQVQWLSRRPRFPLVFHTDIRLRVEERKAKDALNARDRARMNQWISAINSYYYPYMICVRYRLYRTNLQSIISQASPRKIDDKEPGSAKRTGCREMSADFRPHLLTDSNREIPQRDAFAAGRRRPSLFFDRVPACVRLLRSGRPPPAASREY